MRPSHLFTVEGIVLKRRATGEADRIVTVFTRQKGKLRVLAKGIRKVASRRAPHLEIFTHLTLTIHAGKGMDTVTDVSPISLFAGIRSDLPRVGAAYYLSELIDALVPEGQIHEDVFLLLLKGLTALETVDAKRVELLRRRFALALLVALGFLASKKPDDTFDVDTFVESLIERHLKTTRVAAQFS